MKSQNLADNLLFRVGYVGLVGLLFLGLALPGFPYPRLLYVIMALINLVAVICILRSRRERAG